MDQGKQIIFHYDGLKRSEREKLRQELESKILRAISDAEEQGFGVECRGTYSIKTHLFRKPEIKVHGVHIFVQEKQ